MKYAIAAFFVIVLAAIAVAAQSAGMWTQAVNMPIAATATASGCSATVVGVTNWCRTGTAELVSINGAAYIQVWPSPASSPTLTLNGVTKPLPGPFVLSGSTVIAAQ